MAEPARGADYPAPDDPERKPDPRASGWADVRRALAAEAKACALSVAELARDPESGPALEMAALTLSVLEDLGVIARRWEVDEAVIEAERARAFEEGRQACMAERRGRIRAVTGPMRIPSPR